MGQQHVSLSHLQKEIYKVIQNQTLVESSLIKYKVRCLTSGSSHTNIISSEYTH
jgi:hypothetical protein